MHLQRLYAGVFKKQYFFSPEEMFAFFFLWEEIPLHNVFPSTRLSFGKAMRTEAGRVQISLPPSSPALPGAGEGQREHPRTVCPGREDGWGADTLRDAPPVGSPLELGSVFRYPESSVPVDSEDCKCRMSQGSRVTTEGSSPPGQPISSGLGVQWHRGTPARACAPLQDAFPEHLCSGELGQQGQSWERGWPLSTMGRGGRRVPGRC